MAQRSFVRSARRLTQWAGFASAAGGVGPPAWTGGASGTQVIVSLGVIVAGSAGLLGERFTLTRMIGRVATRITTGAAGVEANVVVGCIKVRSEAAGAGVASMPGLVTDPDADWIYHYHLPLHKGTAGSLSDQPFAYHDFDIHSQRKVDGGEALVWMAIADLANIETTVGGRYLMKLS